MDIEQLRRKRQLSVQEQNALTKYAIFREASFWRAAGIPLGLHTALSSRGIDTERSIYLCYEQDFPGINTNEGIVLTPDRKFYRFDMDLNPERSELVQLYGLQDITWCTEINPNRPGTGASWGYLALEVLVELNRSE